MDKKILHNLVLTQYKKKLDKVTKLPSLVDTSRR